MRQILELVPIVLFFVTYKMSGETLQLGSWSFTFDGIFTATAVLMLATAIQVLITWIISREVEKKLWWMLLAVWTFGAATLLFRNEVFIQWKPTIFNWGLAAVLIGSMLMSKKSLLERMLGGQITMPPAAWFRMNLLWIGNFLVVGTLNIYVAYGYSEAAWVNYKLYSSIGFTLLLMVLTVIVLYPYLKHDMEGKVSNEARSD